MKKKSTKKKLRYKLLIAAASFTIMFLIGELIFSLILPNPPRQDDGFFPFMKSSVPQICYELQPGAQGWWQGTYVTVGKQGRRDDDVVVERKKGNIRIAVLGDSETFGLGVIDEDTYCEQLEKLLAKKYCEVINFGVVGYNTEQEAALLKNKVLKYKPDIIIVGYVLNDPAPPLFYRPKRGGVKDPQPAILRLYSWALQNSNLFLWLKTKLRNISYHFGIVNSQRTRYLHNLFDKKSKSWQRNEQALQEIQDTAKNSNIPVVLAIFPMIVNLDASYPYTAIHDQVKTVAEKKGMNVVDLLPHFLGHNPTDLHVDPVYDAHPNKKAHQIIANVLYEFMIAKKIIKGF
ncbi:SGNH/GDSL hydrolase family protein [Candidatus Uabimicrobium sp. HlEnr_7]|uniref:SGNH/GDSL hydrolase family protein n=1 Tax=Candidatus Uabimicrobium helgolandensis TaxID=3095367 RepID=UPI00355715BA